VWGARPEGARALEVRPSTLSHLDRAAGDDRGGRPVYLMARSVSMTETASRRRGKRNAASHLAAGPGPVGTSWPQEHRASVPGGLVRLPKTDLCRAWGDVVGQFEWDAFATLTFDPKRWPRRNRELADRETLWWLGHVGHLYRSPLGWAYAAERGHSGAWHSHALIAGLGNRKWTAPRAAWEERCGFIDVKSVWAGDGISEYITKSVKWDGEVVLSDTLGLYKGALAATAVVELHPSRTHRGR
jgi:hypothetical protein